ncbi:MAG: hypothetical protein M3256_16890 [Actinomycetota bacterium]|nr:hypothetical protein [Actinomycetota bacterium]
MVVARYWRGWIRSRLGTDASPFLRSQVLAPPSPSVAPLSAVLAVLGVYATVPSSEELQGPGQGSA